MKFRFWSDGDIARFEEGAAKLGFPIYVFDGLADVPLLLEPTAYECGGLPEPGQAPTTSGVDALQDAGAFAIRSDGAKQPYYTPTIEPKFFYKQTPKRKTRGQP